MNFKFILSIGVIAAIIYLGLRIIPPYFENYQLQDDITDIAKFAPSTNESDDDIRAEVLKKAKTEGVDITAEMIHLDRNESKSVLITVDYSVPVTLWPNKVIVIKFHDSSAKGSATTAT